MTLSDEEAKVFERLRSYNDYAYSAQDHVTVNLRLQKARNDAIIVLAEEVAKLRSAFEKVTSGGSIVVTRP